MSILKNLIISFFFFLKLQNRIERFLFCLTLSICQFVLKFLILNSIYYLKVHLLDFVLLFNFFLHGFDQLLDLRSELLNLFFEASHFLYLFQVVNINDFLAETIKQMHFRMLFLFLFFFLLLFFIFFDFQLFQESGLVLCFEFIIRLTNLGSSLFIDENVVKVSKIGKMCNQMELILWVPLSIFDCKGIPINIQNLQIFKSCLLVSSPPKIGNNFFETFYLVVSDREDVKLCAVVKAIQNHNFVIVKRKVCEIYQFIKAFDLFDVVE